jgi:hypothetical protein
MGQIFRKYAKITVRVLVVSYSRLSGLRMQQNDKSLLHIFC